MAPRPASGPLPTRNEPLRVAVHSPARIANSALDEKARTALKKVTVARIDSFCLKARQRKGIPESCLIVNVIDTKPPAFSPFVDMYTKCPKCKGLGRQCVIIDPYDKRFALIIAPTQEERDKQAAADRKKSVDLSTSK